MQRKRTTYGLIASGLIIVVAMLLAAPLMVSGETPLQVDPTQQQQTLDAVVNSFFTQTAQYEQNMAATQTIQAAFEQAQTATAIPQHTATAAVQQTMTSEAALNMTAEALFDQALTATVAPQHTATAQYWLNLNTESWQNLRPETNAEWEPIMQAFDRVEMVLVPPGCFEMGSTNGDDDEQPVHRVCFEELFWIDRYEVTNVQFGSTGCEGYSSASDQPRNCVTWFEARDYCESRGARLPTEAEWEYAARGPDGLVYPWGNEFIGENVIYADSPEYGDTKTAPVGSYLNGASWVGAFDMSGNVWEWTNSLYEDYPYDATDGRERDTGDSTDVRRVLRGGSFDLTSYFLRAADRSWNPPGLEAGDVGFRCARSRGS